MCVCVGGKGCKPEELGVIISVCVCMSVCVSVCVCVGGKGCKPEELGVCST